jgi:outer membrane protein TolC
MRGQNLILFLLAATLLRAETLTLKSAQEQLFTNNLDIITAEVEVKKANDELAEARSAWFPSLDASGSYNYLSKRNTLFINPSTINRMLPDTLVEMSMGSNRKTDFGLDLTYPLFTGFSRYYAVTGGKEAVAAKHSMLDGIKNRASLSLGLIYLQWELSYKQMDLRKKLVEQLDEYAKQVTAQREAGTALQSKLLDAQARLQLAKVDMMAAEDQTDSLRRELLSLILGKDNTVAPDTTGFFLDTLPMPKSVDTKRPELIALEHAGAQIDEMRKALRYRHFPTLAALAGLRYGRPGLYLGKDAYMGYGQIGLQLKWNLFDGFSTEARSAQLARQLDFIEIERTRQVETLQRTFDNAKRQVNNALERLSACEESRAAARALAADLKNSLAAGTVTEADYLNALVNQAQAELAVEQAKSAKKMALLKMRYAAGKTITY